jgi:hypothetical protein
MALRQQESRCISALSQRALGLGREKRSAGSTSNILAITMFYISGRVPRTLEAIFSGRFFDLY